MRTRSVELSKGDLVRCTQSYAYNNYPQHLQDDGWLYGTLVTTDPDGDNDVKVTFVDEEGADKNVKGYFDANKFQHVDSDNFTPPWDEDAPDDEILERLENRDEEDALANLQEEQENLVQLGEIRARTVEHGVLELDVKTVTSARNSEKWAIKVEHPVVDELTFYVDKPVMGWSDEYRIVELLREYGIADGNPYKLQARMVYVEYTGGNTDDPDISESWELRTPTEVRERDDSEPSRTVEATRSAASRASVVGSYLLDRAAPIVFTILAAVSAGLGAGAATSGNVLMTMVAIAAMFLSMYVVAMSTDGGPS